MWFWLWPWFRSGLARHSLRRASVLDAGRMAAIHAEGFAIGWSREEFEQMILDRAIADVLVSQAPFGHVVTGFAISRVAADEAELLSIALDPEVRGLSLSSALLDRHMGHAAQAGARTMFLEVAENNGPALALYRQAGFVEVGRRKGYYSGSPGSARHDAFTMQADLGRFDPTPRFG
ncbi:GNAT family N-acetyltransferase [Rhabdaerophilum sp. SD176]|uniref:GNAT family N-acetyltransferase n=1 Tax=Rhabdaerophilum sp. SD176 TaxID=2983548 RepID=UPI0024DF590A|nr:GNAT family N-acetyltransferase [Rhabdaerophilum sp. SD176]